MDLEVSVAKVAFQEAHLLFPDWVLKLYIQISDHHKVRTLKFAKI